MLTKASNVEDKICPDYIDSVHGVGFFFYPLQVAPQEFTKA